MEETDRPQIDKLLRGISTNHVETVRDAWRELLNQGENSVPAVLAKLASPAWEENPRGPVAKYLGVLLAILDELDSDAFKYEIDRLLKSKLHPLHRKTIEILSQRIFDEPATHIGSNVPVFVADEVTDRSVVIKNLGRWSETRDLSLDNVTRVDVIARHPQLDYLGRYNLFFSGIILTWPIDRARGVRFWYRGLDAEFTFYHEVGHHVSGHLEGGSVAEQEEEANEYARSMMRKSRPVLALLVRILLWPFKHWLVKFVPRISGGRSEAF